MFFHLSFFVYLFIFTSCSLEMSHNGHLDGFWQLTRVDTLASGKSVDVGDKLLFLSVECDMLRLSDQATATVDCFCRFELGNTTLRIYNPCRNDRPNGDPPLTDAAPLKPFGIESLDQTFDIEHLSSGAMTLRSHDLRLHYSKR